MAESQLRSGPDYHALFDPEAYLSRYFTKEEGSEVIKSALKGLQAIYTAGEIKGNRIIDIGAGPTIHFLIPAAKYFDELFISDVVKRNIETHKKWLARDPDSFDWQNFFEYFAEKDGKKDRWPQYETLLRNKIKAVLACDVHQPNPLHPETMGQFDAVCTSLALESSCKDLDQFRKAMKNVVSLITPGGFFILYTVLKNPFYTVGVEKFWCLSLTYEEVLDSVTESGVEVVKIIEDNCKVSGECVLFDGSVMVLGRKKLEI